jgi:hypothetical protein
MANYAIVKNEEVINVIVAKDAKTALKYGGGSEVLETTGTPWIGWIRVNDEWVEPTSIEELSD